MEIVVPVKMVPDVVEELEIDASGRTLDRSFLKLRINEFDEHAVEEALLLKEKHGGKVTVVALDAPEVDEALFTCMAKGADRIVKVTGGPEEAVTSHEAARILGEILKSIPCDLVLTGVQSAEDRDGQVGPLLAGILGLPHVSVVSAVDLLEGGRSVVVKQEYAGGLMAEIEVDLPALLGIQAAGHSPRYASVSKVRQLMKTAKIDEVAVTAAPSSSGSEVLRLFKPEAAGRAKMLEGSPEEVADQLVALFSEKGFVKG
jgi:electron transfer flavoprotein beta subunit